MRHTTRRRKAGRADGGAGVSLFPFLAVLVCTVGALVLLLIVLGRHARLQAAQAAELTQSEKTQADNSQGAVEGNEKDGVTRIVPGNIPG